MTHSVDVSQPLSLATLVLLHWVCVAVIGDMNQTNSKDVPFSN